MKIAFYCRVDGQGFGFVLPEEADKLREFFAEHQDKPALENPSSASRANSACVQEAAGTTSIT